MIVASPWWKPHVHADRRPALLARGRIKSALRAWFEGQGFVEVDTGCLQVSPGNEAHLHAFETEAIGTDFTRRQFYLHTSPEFACKKLLAAGETRIFTFAPCFRNRERGPLHHPEFTMLEWYRVGAPYQRLWQDCGEFLRIAAETTGRSEWNWLERHMDARAPLETVTVDDAFTRHAGVSLAHAYDADGVDLAAMRELADSAGIRLAVDDTWSDVFSRVLTERVEPWLGSPAATILSEYPAHEAALAQPVPDRPEVAERFELYCCGIELANGFGELTDAVQQRRRLTAEMDEKARVHGERYPIDEDFIAALAEMPPASGCALGFDRLVMLATGAAHIDRVIWTPMP